MNESDLFPNEILTLIFDGLSIHEVIKIAQCSTIMLSFSVSYLFVNIKKRLSCTKNANHFLLILNNLSEIETFHRFCCIMHSIDALPFLIPLFDFEHKEHKEHKNNLVLHQLYHNGTKLACPRHSHLLCRSSKIKKIGKFPLC